MNNNKKNVLQTLWGWLRRMVMGASKEYADEVESKQENSINDVEEIISPTKQYVRNFLEHKIAVFALCVVIAMFITVFVGPLFMKNYSDSYTEVTQKSIAPTMSMMSVPKELDGNIKMIDSYGSFSVGLSNDGEVYVWGATAIGTTGIDMKDIPQEVKDANIVMVAAGIDHIIAIGDDGKIYGWGNNRFGQYDVPLNDANSPNIILMPEELRNNGIDVANIKRLECGYQCTAILMNDRTLHIWGNKHAYANIDKFVGNTNLNDIAFTLNYVVGVPMQGNAIYTGTRGLYNQARPALTASTTELNDYLDGRFIQRIDATSNNICLTLSDNSICFVGDFGSSVVEVPVLKEGEYFVDIASGTYHYTGITNEGNVYSWGGNHFDQAEAPSKASGAKKIYAAAFQNYAVDENDSVQAKWGLKGYIFGTDVYGADIFQRIINGGQRTMTIGAVAVIISSIIGIIVGCVAGYFGGFVDIILMRVTEIFAAIPFLPFALTLSAVMSQMTLSEDMRIFIIMVILGLLSWTGLARLVRGQVLVARENEYVLAAQAMGVKESKIAFKHILPNVISVIIVTLTLDFAGCMLTESSLSYLGFGVAYPRPTWGNMLNGANNATIIKNYWWQWLFTSIFLAATTICINIVGDTLRDVMDPKSNIEK
ncbi:MAG: ABC transporter permease subunit [Oscillospiraceae bacterium]|nr:ABC transporter permease subunit [Oscillospiraceae bacterium]